MDLRERGGLLEGVGREERPGNDVNAVLMYKILKRLNYFFKLCFTDICPDYCCIHSIKNIYRNYGKGSLIS